MVKCQQIQVLIGYQYNGISSLLQALWRWLFNASNNIRKIDRPHLLNIFKELMYAKSSLEYQIAKEKILSDETVEQYPKYLNHLERSYFSRHEKWAMFIRIELQLPTNNCNTNNYIEASFRVLKENTLNRTKVKTNKRHFLSNS